MTDTKELEKIMERSDISISFISENIGIENESFSRKMNNICEFSASEIVCMKQVLNLSNEERDKIFLHERLN